MLPAFLFTQSSDTAVSCSGAADHFIAKRSLYSAGQGRFPSPAAPHRSRQLRIHPKTSYLNSGATCAGPKAMGSLCWSCLGRMRDTCFFEPRTFSEAGTSQAEKHHFKPRENNNCLQGSPAKTWRDNFQVEKQWRP